MARVTSVVAVEAWVLRNGRRQRVQAEVAGQDAAMGTGAPTTVPLGMETPGADRAGHHAAAYQPAPPRRGVWLDVRV